MLVGFQMFCYDPSGNTGQEGKFEAKSKITRASISCLLWNFFLQYACGVSDVLF